MCSQTVVYNDLLLSMCHGSILILKFQDLVINFQRRGVEKLSFKINFDFNNFFFDPAL